MHLHPLDPLCHPLQYVCSPFVIEGEGEFIVEVLVMMVREVVVHQSLHYLLPYPPPPHTYPSPDIFIPTQTYTSPSIPSTSYTYVPSPMSLEPASMTVDMTLSVHTLSSPTLPPIDETIVDLISELAAVPTRRPRSPRIPRVLHPSAPSAPSTPSAPSDPSAPFETVRDT